MAGSIKDIDKGWAGIKRELAGIKGMSVVVGWIDGKNAAEAHEGGLTNVQLATIHEFGAPKAGIPERSFLRAGLDANREPIVALFDAMAKRLFDARNSGERIYGQLGAKASALVKRFVTSGQVQPQHRKAVKGQKGPVALIDTGRLVSSLTWQVRKGGG